MSILFTGHKGFLGRELIPALSMLDEIVVFDGDLLDFEAVRIFAEKCSVTKIFHAAARGGREKPPPRTVSGLVMRPFDTLKPARTRASTGRITTLRGC